MPFKVHHCHGEDLHIFFHPDLSKHRFAVTVGFGVSPNRPFARFADYTASGEFHPALKTSVHLFLLSLYTLLSKLQERLCKTSVLFFIDFQDRIKYNKGNQREEDAHNGI